MQVDHSMDFSIIIDKLIENPNFIMIENALDTNSPLTRLEKVIQTLIISAIHIKYPNEISEILIKISKNYPEMIDDIINNLIKVTGIISFELLDEQI